MHSEPLNFEQNIYCNLIAIVGIFQHSMINLFSWNQRTEELHAALIMDSIKTLGGVL